MQSETPLVSVIVPTHDSAGHLTHCIGSLLAQTYANIEVICVDDGSSDGTLDLLHGYESSDSRVRVIAQENAGPGAARNRGIEAARGTYLYFLDSDDWVDAHLVQRAVARLEETGAQIAIFPYMELDERVGEARTTPWAVLEGTYQGDVFSWRDNPDWIFRSMQNLMWNKVFSAELIRQGNVRCQEEVRLTEDLMFTAPALVLAERLTYLHEALVYHRSGTGGNTMADKDSHPLDFYRAFLTFKKWLMDQGVFDELEVAYVNWAADACMYNLHTLHTLEGFRLVYDTLAGEGLRQLGLLDVPIDAFHEPRHRDMVERLQTNTVEEYLFHQFKVASDESGLGWYNNDVSRARTERERAAREQVERQRDELQSRLDVEVAEHRRLQGELSLSHAEADVLRAELDEAHGEIRALRESTSFKLGNAFVDPAVKVRNALHHGK